MDERSPPLLGNLDWTVLGQTMRRAADAAHIGLSVSMLEPNGLQTVYVNDAAAEILGWSVEELLERDPMANMAPEDLPFTRERLSRRFDGERGQAHYEIMALRKDGTHVPIEVSASDVTIDGRRAVFSFIFDLTARKAAEQSRFRTEARFRELIEKGPEPIGIIRADQFVYANAALVKMLGRRSAEELHRTPLDQLVVPEDVPALRVRMKALAEDETLRTPSQIYRGRRADGSILVIEASSVPFEYEGQRSILTMLRDVTERRALEARLVQADRLAALGTMAAGVAHEINNPLAYVMLNLDWIARKLSERHFDAETIDGLSEMLREAKRGTERVATIVRELRSFSRTDHESHHAVDLASVVQSAIRISAHEITHRARVTTTFGPVTSVWGNEGRVEQVLLNLLLNAAQAMPEASAATNAIHVSVRADAAGRAVLEVADNGDGIPPEVLPRIFDPFFTTKAPSIGTGLGLSICHGIVESLGGTITVHSEPGKGTTFRIVFPTTGIETTKAPSVPPEPPAAQYSRRARVLIVDDEMHIGNTMRELLQRDHDVVAATSGMEALAAAQRGPEFDVIFCDLMMPGMDGIQLFGGLRTHRAGLERRIVFMTGGAFTPGAAEFLASIDNRRLEKPFSLGLVERIVREMAEGPP